MVFGSFISRRRRAEGSDDLHRMWLQFLISGDTSARVVTDGDDVVGFAVSVPLWFAVNDRIDISARVLVLAMLVLRGPAAVFAALVAVLIGDPSDANLGTAGKLGERSAAGFADGSLPIRNGVAVGIDAWMAQQLIDPVQHLVRNTMFQFLGLGVNLRPVQLQHFHQKQFQQSMSS